MTILSLLHPIIVPVLNAKTGAKITQEALSAIYIPDTDDEKRIANNFNSLENSTEPKLNNTYWDRYHTTAEAVSVIKEYNIDGVDKQITILLPINSLISLVTW